MSGNAAPGWPAGPGEEGGGAPGRALALVELPSGGALGRAAASAAGQVVAVVDGQRGALFPWVPVFLAGGIGWYFALPAEPSGQALILALAGAAALGALAALTRRSVGPILLAPALVLVGLALAGERARQVAAPVLGYRYYGPVEGRIVGIDRSAAEALRLTLDEVVLRGMSPARTPARVRVSLYGAQDWVVPEPGLRVILTANLSPPEPPVSPGGYDFRRQAWFDQLGGVGYTRSPVLLLEPARGGTDLVFARLRAAMSVAIRADLPGQPGAFAATIMTGDRSALSRRTSDDLRAANLSHLLAISGLHMMLLAGSVFAALRFALAAVPGLALHRPIRKWAAFGAILVGFGYYLLSGRAVPAERAWVMVLVVFGAVIFERRAISLRSVALAALVVLGLRPESLVEPGFQMSFAATIALVTAFRSLRGRLGWVPRWLNGPVSVLVSSLVAGLATAPIAAAHFNRIAEYGLAANLAAVPLMGLAVMPLALIWVVATPLGLGGAAMALMEWPVRWILGVAAFVAALPGAVTPVVAPGPGVLPLIGAGGVVLALWQGRARVLGLAPLALGFWLWAGTERPALLVSGEGALVGLMTPEGRALSKPKGQRFPAAVWLEDDGDLADQAGAARRPGLARGNGEVRFALGGIRIVQVTGRGATARAGPACDGADLVLTTVRIEGRFACPIWDETWFRKAGSVAVWPGPEGLRLRTVGSASARRFWSPAPPPDLGPLPDGMVLSPG